MLPGNRTIGRDSVRFWNLVMLQFMMTNFSVTFLCLDFQGRWYYRSKALEGTGVELDRVLIVVKCHACFRSLSFLSGVLIVMLILRRVLLTCFYQIYKVVKPWRSM